MRAVVCIISILTLAGVAHTAPQTAITAFVAHCMTKGMTAAQAHERMAPDAGGFELTFFDKSLAPAPGTPDHVERRCEVIMDGDHSDQAIAAVQAKMATPPVFGTPIALPSPYAETMGTALIEARELLQKRMAVIHIGTRDAPVRTFIRVDRLPPDRRAP